MKLNMQTRYFVTFYHFQCEVGYHTGTLTSFTIEGNKPSTEIIVEHLLDLHKMLTTSVNIVATVEISKDEFHRLSLK